MNGGQEKKFFENIASKASEKFSIFLLVEISEVLEAIFSKNCQALNQI